MRTKDEIIVELFALLAGASYSGALLKEEEELYNQLLNEYYGKLKKNIDRIPLSGYNKIKNKER